MTDPGTPEGDQHAERVDESMDSLDSIEMSTRDADAQPPAPSTALPARTKQMLEAAAAAAADKLATDVIAFDVADRLALTDAFLIASASNDRQVGAIVDAVEERLSAMGAKPIAREGAQEGRWVLLDYADIVVHVQHEEERRFYALERLWRDCPQITLDAVEGLDSADAGRAAGTTQPDGPA